MLEVSHVWAAALLPLPIAVMMFLRSQSAKQQALQVPSLAQWQTQQDQQQLPKANRTQWLPLVLIWLALVFSISNPVWYGEPVEQTLEGRDILLAVDISGSMRLKDMTLQGRYVDRLTAAKSVISQFVAKRQGDRLGLILYGSNAYMHVPLTTDLKTLNTLLYESRIGFAGNETAIGDAIGLGLKRLHELKHDQRMMILLTDGNNSAGAMEPLEAANIAAEQGLKIYTIGVGSRQGLRALFGGSSGVDESTLTQIAQLTGGQHFTATDTAELEQIYQYIDALEPTPDQAESIRPQRSLAWYGLLAALGLSVLSYGLLPLFKRLMR